MLGPEEPCEAWATEDDLCCDVSAVPPARVTAALLAATQYLYDATCRRWPGTCTATVRPCLPCGCRTSCTCKYTRLNLPSPYKITAVTSVTVNGVLMLPGDYRLDENRGLVLQEDNSLSLRCWPPQNLDLPDGDPDGTWEVAYEWGAPPITLAIMGSADLACELIKACNGEECDLPANVQTISRQGVTLTFRDPNEGYTNVPTADLLIRKYRCKMTPRLIDPDVPLVIYRGP